jgi:hypothetical protein
MAFVCRSGRSHGGTLEPPEGNLLATVRVPEKSKEARVTHFLFSSCRRLEASRASWSPRLDRAKAP